MLSLDRVKVKVPPAPQVADALSVMKAVTVFCLLLLVGAPAVLGAGLSLPVQPAAQVHADKSSFLCKNCSCCC